MIRNIDEDVENIERQIQQGIFFEPHEFLYYIAKRTQPKTYLEIGVFWGRSLALVLKASPQTQGYGIDTWKPHGGLENASPEKLIDGFQEMGIENAPTLLSGCSYLKLPELWGRDKIPQTFQLIFVDGEHGYDGAKKDLELCFPRLEEGGILVFDDTVLHPHLNYLFSSFKEKMPDFLFLESRSRTGVCVAFKPPISGEIFCR